MSYFKGFGTASNSYGQFWFGGSTFPGFLYKKNNGGGARKNPKYGLICNKSTDLYNKYKPGTGGVGASSVATRRAKNRHATVCYGDQCGQFYNYLGQYPSINVLYPDPLPVPGSMFFQNSFDPSGSYVQYGNNSGLTIGTNSFTIEWFENWREVSDTYPRIFSIGSYSEGNIKIAVSYEGGFVFWTDTTTDIFTQPPQNVWNHIAIVGTSGVGIKIYINGVEEGSLDGPYNILNDTSLPLTIGNESVPSKVGNLDGNITNFRWVNGTAIYNNNFTPPTTDLSNVPGTQLLLLTKRSNVVKDSSSVRRPVINNGVTFSPLKP